MSNPQHVLHQASNAGKIARTSELGHCYEYCLEPAYTCIQTHCRACLSQHTWPNKLEIHVTQFQSVQVQSDIPPKHSGVQAKITPIFLNHNIRSQPILQANYVSFDQYSYFHRYHFQHKHVPLVLIEIPTQLVVKNSDCHHRLCSLR